MFKFNSQSTQGETKSHLLISVLTEEIKGQNDVCLEAISGGEAEPELVYPAPALSCFPRSLLNMPLSPSGFTDMLRTAVGDECASD